MGLLDRLLGHDRSGLKHKLTRTSVREKRKLSAKGAFRREFKMREEPRNSKSSSLLHF
jgi:hypothetical protein